MISLEVRRTLVKSPPELWAELSDPDRLARHLRELGDIRIVGTDPEQMVEWEAQGARGSVFLKPSGWGTKVTLTVLRELGEPANPATSGAPSEPGLPASEPGPPASEPPTDPEPPLTPEAAFEPGPPVTTSTLTDPEPGATFVARAEPEPPVTTEVLTDPYPEPAARSEAPLQSEPPAHETEPEPRRGFFARLFGRRGGRAGPEAEGPDSVEAAEQEPATSATPGPHENAIACAEPDATGGPAAEPKVIGAPETEAGRRPLHDAAATVIPQSATGGPAAPEWDATAAAQPETAEPGETREPGELAEPVQLPSDAGVPDISAELRIAEEVAAEQVRAVLTSMLDRLGAAHHRPFSRA